MMEEERKEEEGGGIGEVLFIIVYFLADSYSLVRFQRSSFLCGFPSTFISLL